MKNVNLSYTLHEQAAKLDESDFESIFGKSITFERVTDSDRAAIELGMQQLKRGVNGIDSDDPKILRAAALRMVIGAFILGAHTLMSDSVKKFLDVARDGAKGKKSAITRRKKMQEWQDYVRNKLPELRRKNPTLTPNDLAENIRSKSTRVRLPCHERLVGFIRAELKSGATKKTNPPRLVHG